MPLYSYHCKKCDEAFESLIDSATVATCPHCGSRRLSRLMSRVAPPGRSGAHAKSMRAQAGREGHLSNFKRSEL
jgi:putative FmdB family regulatory protein